MGSIIYPPADVGLAASAVCPASTRSSILVMESPSFPVEPDTEAGAMVSRYRFCGVGSVAPALTLSPFLLRDAHGLFVEFDPRSGRVPIAIRGDPMFPVLGEEQPQV